MEIKLYTTGCPKCQILERKLDSKGFGFKKITDNEVIMEKAEEYNTMSVPFCEVNGNFKSFKDMMEWINI